MTTAYTIIILDASGAPIPEAGYTLHAPDADAALRNAETVLRLPMTPRPEAAVIKCEELASLLIHPLWSAAHGGLLLVKP